MNPIPELVPYRVMISVRVREQIRDLLRAARARGDGETFLAALAEFERRLRVYPQFGEPMVDLKRHTGQVWIGTVRPITLRYTVFDELRVVNIGAKPVLLPKSKGSDAGGPGRSHRCVWTWHRTNRAGCDRKGGPAMATVFGLHHLHTPDDGAEAVKFIGVYSSRETAAAAVARLSRRPGFSDTPDGFHIDEYRVDQDQWAEGDDTEFHEDRPPSLPRREGR